MSCTLLQRAMHMRSAWNQAKRQAISTRTAAACCRPRVHAQRRFSTDKTDAAALSELLADFSPNDVNAAAAAPAVATAAASSLRPPLTRYACVVEYDGSLFHGWSPSAERSRESSVAGAIEACVSMLVGGRSVKVVGSGRTDRGVHGLGQVFHVDLDRGLNAAGTAPSSVLSAARFRTAVNHHLSMRGHHGIQLLHSTIVPPEIVPHFHARHACIRRTYLYRLFVTTPNAGDGSPPSACSLFDRDRCAHLRADLDLSAMEAALRLMDGKLLDFAAYQSMGCSAASSVRMMEQARMSVERQGFAAFDTRYPSSSASADLSPAASRHSTSGLQLSFHFSSRSFLYHQIRNMVGMLMQVGRGRCSLRELAETLEVDSGKAAANTAEGIKERARIHGLRTRVGRFAASPHGLYLHRVDYPWNLHDWTLRQHDAGAMALLDVMRARIVPQPVQQPQPR